VGGGAALLARGIWWRRWASLILVLCAAITVAGAAAGPLWGRASQASLLERSLQEARVSDRAWTATGTTDAYDGLVFPRPPPSQLYGDVRSESRLPPELNALFDQPTERVEVARRLQVKPIDVEPADAEDEVPALVRTPLGRLVAREGVCEQVELLSGDCPRGRSELLLSNRSAAVLQVTAGDQVQIPELERDFPPARGREALPAAFTVSGVYRAQAVRTDSRFWFDGEELEYSPATVLGGEPVPARLDAVLVQPEVVLAVRSIAVRVQVERALRPGAVTLANADRVAQELTARAGSLAATSRIVDATATVAATISASVPGRQRVADTATFVGLQVVVFGWVVLFGLVAISVGARHAEMALAKLRGLRGFRLAAHALTEPVGLVLVAVPLGLLGAWAAVTVLAGWVLLPDTPVAVPSGVWWAVGATVGGAVLACALAARRSLRMPVADQLRRQPVRAGAAGPVVTAVLLTLASVGLLLVLTLGRSAQTALPALLTPVVVGLAAGVVVGRVVQVATRLVAARTHSWSLGPYLAIRQLARQSSMTHTTALLTVATAVGGFAAAAYVVTATQREAQARIDIGAERVVHVAPLPTADLLVAARQVDPEGRWSMAAVQRGEGAQTLLAVDSSRFSAAFGVPRGSLAQPGALDQLIPPDLVEPLVVRGSTASVTVRYPTVVVRAEEPFPDGEVAQDVRLGLQLRVTTPEGTVRGVLLGALDPEAETQTLTARVQACAKGCTVTSLFLTRTSGIGAVTGNVTLDDLEIGGRSYPFAPGEWRPARVDESVPDSASATTLRGLGGREDGLVVAFDATPSMTPGLVRRDVPTELPAIVGEQSLLNLIGARELVEGTTLEGNRLPFSVAGRTPVLPRASGGSIVDLELVSRVEPPRSAGLDFQVWLGETAPADAPQRLAAAGLEVRQVESRADRRGELDRAEPARAQLLLLGAGAAILLTGVAGIATVLAATARRRSVEAAALHAMAVPGRVVRGSAVLEDALLLLPGVVAGAVCAGSLVTALAPVLAEVTGAAAVVAGPPATAAVVLPVMAAAAVTCLLLVPVVLVVTRPASDETPMRAAT